MPSLIPQHSALDTSSWWNGITRYQWLVLFVAWLGWVFDAMDATIYAIVLHPALHELLHTPAGPASPEQIGWYGGIIFSIFLIGWAIGGIAFGIAADRFGRTKTLIATILIYAVFTGLAALSQDWWHLAIYRFLTALGIGGEWAAGAAIVAETWPEANRAKAAGILQSAWAVGFFSPPHSTCCSKDRVGVCSFSSASPPLSWRCSSGSGSKNRSVGHRLRRTPQFRSPPFFPAG